MDADTEPLQVELTLGVWQSASDQLAAASGLPAPAITDAAAKGAVWRQKNPAAAGRIRRLYDLGDAKAGDKLLLNFNASVLAQHPAQPELVSDQGNYSIWNKPAGMLCQGSKWSDHTTITRVVEHTSNKPAYLVHRLDKAASGLIVIAHTRNATSKLATLFEQRQVQKLYRAVVKGQVELSLPHLINADIDGKTSTTRILTAEPNSADSTTSLLVSIDTGRKHQIRAHLTGIGHPIVGDRLFDNSTVHDKDLQLQAVKLAFTCPFSGKELAFELPTTKAD